jgi:ankyrin repeat protein
MLPVLKDIYLEYHLQLQSHPSLRAVPQYNDALQGTILHVAAYLRDEALVEHLLQRGANVNAISEGKWCVLNSALAYKDDFLPYLQGRPPKSSSILTHLLRRGKVDPNPRGVSSVAFDKVLSIRIDY